MGSSAEYAEFSVLCDRLGGDNGSRDSLATAIFTVYLGRMMFYFSKGLHPVIIVLHPTSLSAYDNLLVPERTLGMQSTVN